MRNQLSDQSVPPQIPSDDESLVRAIQLLGNLVGIGKLKEPAAAELRALVGGLPTIDEAAAWKRSLKWKRKRQADVGIETQVEANKAAPSVPVQQVEVLRTVRDMHLSLHYRWLLPEMAELWTPEYCQQMAAESLVMVEQAERLMKALETAEIDSQRSIAA